MTLNIVKTYDSKNFSVFFSVQLGELGNLEDTDTYDEAEDWDTQIDIEGVDKALREVRDFFT